MKKLLYFIFFCFVFISYSTQAQIPTNGMIAYYPFDGNANDKSGNNFNGTVVGATLTTDRFGNANSAYSFNGTSNYISVADNNTLDIGVNDYSLVSWIKTSATGQGRIISKGSTNCTPGYMMRMHGPGIWVENATRLSSPIRDTCLSFTSTGVAVNNNRWRCVVNVVKRNSYSRIYVDGVLYRENIRNTSSFDLSNITDLRIGTNETPTTSPEWFNGSIDDIRVYNRALTDVEISSIYNEPDYKSCRYQDSIALVRFYNATNGQNWTSAYRWDFSESMENWKGVGLNDEGCVGCLDLDGDSSVCYGWSDNPPGVGLSGAFPTAIGKLTDLDRLHLRGNRNLTGQIPDSIRYLTKLAALYLDSTDIGGSFPDGFRGLVNLVDFSGYNTPYSNTLPDFFDNIKNLEVFNFNDTQTSGKIPPSLVKSDSLRRLYLARNKLTGVVPIELAGRLMHGLDLSDNDFDSLPKLNLVKWNVPFVGNPFVSLQGNRFTFDDIVPNIKSLPADFTKTYAPQDSIFKDTTITVRVGDPLSIDLKIDGGIPDNVYSWKRGSSTVISDGSQNLNRFIRNAASLADAGVYTCVVTNSSAVDLKLYSRKITVVVNSPLVDTNSCRYKDSLQLISLYNATKGQNWAIRNVNGQQSPWDTAKSINTWYGVTLNTEGCVNNVILNQNNLEGNLPNLNLPNLVGLNLDSNLLSGNIPNLKLPNLQSLALPRNQLKGVIPNFNLPNLKYLYLNTNPLNTSIPNFDSLPNLQELYLYSCGLIGSIPNFQNSSNLIHLNLADNPLSGNIPDFNLPKLQYLIIALTNVTDSIPVSIGNLRQLVYLHLSSNKFLTGTIPSSIGSLTLLESLGLGSDNLNGTIPLEIGNCSNLKSLFLDSNKSLEGSIPSSIGNLKRLKILWLQGNKFSGEIPASLGLLDSLEDLALNINQLTGSVPTTFNQLKVKRLLLSSNRLNEIPNLTNIPLKDSITDVNGFRRAGGLWVSSNALTFSSILPNLPLVQFTKFTYNLQDSIYKDTTIAITQGKDLTIDLKIDSTITSNIYKWVRIGRTDTVTTIQNKLILRDIKTSDAGIYTCKVTNTYAPNLTLYSRKINVVVSPDTNSCRYRDSVQLVLLYNALGTGWTNRWDLTQPMTNWDGVKFNSQGCVSYLNLANRKLTGFITANLYALTNLDTLSLGNNPLLQSWALSEQIGNLIKLKEINVFACNLTGSIPSQIGKLTNLRLASFGANNLTGVIPKEIGQLINLDRIYFGSNPKLTGEIPTTVGNIPELRDFRAEGCNLTGAIPSEFGDCKKLELLYLNGNSSLTGKVPTSLRQTKLIVLNIENDNIDSIPDLSNLPIRPDNTTSAWGLRIGGNKVTFDDILPNIGFASSATFIYTPQDSIFKDTTYNLTVGSNLTINLGIDATLTGANANKYVWIKNGIRIDSSNQNTKIIKGVVPCDAGTYTVEVTNTAAPLLTLKSHKITVNVNALAPTSRNKAICFGQKDTLPKGRIVSIAGTYRDTLKNSKGCDSAIIITNLTVAPIRVEKFTQNLCLGTNLKIKDSLVTKGGIYRDTIKSAEGCITVNEITVIIDSTKVVKEDSLCKGQKYRLPSGTIVDKIGEYRDVVKRAGKCDTIYTVILKEGCLPLVKVYNGITPDGDDNKYLVVEEIAEYPKSQLLIYSRTNDLIFRSAIPYDNKWNGTDQNGTPLPADTYYYILDLGLPNQKPLKGYILLMR